MFEQCIAGVMSSVISSGLARQFSTRIGKSFFKFGHILVIFPHYRYIADLSRIF